MATARWVASKRRRSICVASGMVTSENTLKVSICSILKSSLLRARSMEKRGLGKRPACTRSASEMPSSENEACSPRLFSSAICTASSIDKDEDEDEGFCSSSRTRVAMASRSASVLAHLRSLPMRSLVVCSTAPKPPSDENEAQPVKASAASPAARYLADERKLIIMFRAYFGWPWPACPDSRFTGGAADGLGCSIGIGAALASGTTGADVTGVTSRASRA